MPSGYRLAEALPRWCVKAPGRWPQPIVVCGDGENCPIAVKAAEQLEQAGFKEVWTYCGDPQAWVNTMTAAKPAPTQVVSDPDLN